MPIIKKKVDKFFPKDYMYASQSSLLKTIRVPKNLMYLTDRLPKPNYEDNSQGLSAEKKRREQEEWNKRRTHDAGDGITNMKQANSRKEIQKKLNKGAS